MGTKGGRCSVAAAAPAEEVAVVLFVPDHVLWLDTGSGSRYRIDPEAMTWTREIHDARSDALRTESGPFVGLEEEPRVGASTVILGPAFVPGADFRWLLTTTVVRIWHEQPTAAHAPVAGWWDEAE